MTEQERDLVHEAGASAPVSVTGGYALMMGLMLSGDRSRSEGIDSYAARILGEEIGGGFAHAACIEAGREWFLDKCRK